MKKFLLTCAVAAVLGVPAYAAAASGPTSAPTSAYEAIQKGEWREAEAMLRQALAQNPTDAPRLLNLAFVLQNMGRQDEAVKVYRQVLKLNGNPMVSVDDPNVLSRPARAKVLAKKGIASLEKPAEQ